MVHPKGENSMATSGFGYENLTTAIPSSEGLVQNCMTHDVFHTKQQHFTPSSAPAHHFFTTLKSHTHKVVQNVH